MKKQNKWLDALIAALEADKDHEEALAALVKEHGGKRTEALMADLLQGIRFLFPQTGAEITCRKVAGVEQYNVSFANGNTSGESCWVKKIKPHLPNMRAPTGGKKKAASPIEKAEKALAALRADGLTKAQAFAAVELAFSKRK